jgi:F-type H+-transporting ATPase subunit gamma
MSSTLETLQKQIASGEDLSSIVKTMKALAATSVRQYEKAAESLDDYYHTVELGLSVVLSSEFEIPAGSKSKRPKRQIKVVFGSDHGLAGRFNEQIVSFVLEDDQEPGSLILAIGEQVINRLQGAGITPARELHMPGSISAITPFVQSLLEEIEQLRLKEDIEKVVLYFNRPRTASFSPVAETMLPVDLENLRETRLKWQSRSLPTFTMPAGRLLSALLRQYFIVSLYRACALSLAAENTSRLAAMQAAEKNINERLDQLKVVYQHERQAAITEELLDIISGFRAVRAVKTIE